MPQGRRDAAETSRYEYGALALDSLHEQAQPTRSSRGAESSALQVRRPWAAGFAVGGLG